MKVMRRIRKAERRAKEDLRYVSIIKVRNCTYVFPNRNRLITRV